MIYAWQFPDWTKKQQPKAAEFRILELVAAHLCRPRARRDAIERRLEMIVAGLLNVHPDGVSVLIVRVDAKRTIIEVRNNG